MSDLTDLYQQVILDHNKRPRNFRKSESAELHADGYNPLCGDRISVYVDMDGETIGEISFHGSGCAISKASASLMTEALKGKSAEDAAALFERFHELVTGKSGQGGTPPGLGKLGVFEGVKEFPVRVKCATLPWHTMRAALDRRPETVSTE